MIISFKHNLLLEEYKNQRSSYINTYFYDKNFAEFSNYQILKYSKDFVKRFQDMSSSTRVSIILLATNSHSIKSLKQTSSLTSVFDRTLGYYFEYSNKTSNKDFLNILNSRRPERYSSAAPMSVEARQRIVCQLIDFNIALIISVSVSSPTEFLKKKHLKDWKAQEVVEEVLFDKSIDNKAKSNEQSVLDKVEKIETKTINKQTYWYYEHTSQASPSPYEVKGKDIFRRILSVSSVRLGIYDKVPYIYTLNISCPNSLWDEIKNLASYSIKSFRLKLITKDYVSPEIDPWKLF